MDCVTYTKGLIQSYKARMTENRIKIRELETANTTLSYVIDELEKAVDFEMEGD